MLGNASLLIGCGADKRREKGGADEEGRWNKL